MYKRNSEIIIIFVWFILVIVTLVPSVVESAVLYRGVKLIIFGLLFLLSLVVSIYKAFKSPFLQRVLVMVLIIGILFLVLYSFGLPVRWQDCSNLIIILWVMCLGFRCELRQNDFEMLVLLFGILSIILGAYSLVLKTGTISLSTYAYLVDTKNQIGQVVATGGIGLMLIAQSSNKKKNLRTALYVLSIGLLIILRCRTALIAALLVLLLYFIKSTRFNYKILFVYVAILTVILFSSYLFDLLDSVFIGTHDVNDINSVSADRWHRNVDGLAFFYYNPIWGELKVESGIDNIHNYVIKRMVGYGVFAIPFIIFYVAFAIRVLKDIFTRDIRDIWNIGLFMLAVPFFASLLEPSAPFGPGLVQCIPFFFYGLFTRHSHP